jgi:hypothetical protein
MNRLARALAVTAFALAASVAHADRYPDTERPLADHRVYQVTPAQARAELQIWRESGLAQFDRLGQSGAGSLHGHEQARARFEFLMASERHAELVRHFSVGTGAPPPLAIDLRNVGPRPSGLARAEVLADLRDWLESGMAEFDRAESGQHGADGRYQAAQARYARLRELRVLAGRLDRAHQG